MTREEAIKILKELAGYEKTMDLIQNYSVSVQDALYMAIKELEQEPCDKCVYSTSEGCQYDDITETIPPFDKTGWIPVSERLPEHYQNILFSTKTDRVFEGRYFKDETEHQWYSFRDECFAWNNVVTAWMPLPEPYKAEGSGEA